MKQKERIEFRYYEVPLGFPIIALMGKDWEVPYGNDAMHFHNYLEIGICRYGEGTMYFGKETAPYHDGTITVIPKNFPHHTTGINDDIQKWEYLFIDSETFLTETYAERPHYAKKLLKQLHSRMFIINEANYSEIYPVLNMILNEMEKKTPFYKECVCSMLLVLLLKIIQINRLEEIEEPKEEKMVNLDSIVTVLNYIHLNYAENIRIADLAKIGNMSETHFRRTFSEYMNITPMEYINFVRIEKACELLRKSDAQVEEIAIKVGFPVATTFSRNFKKITGYSPMHWKTMTKNEENVMLDYNVSVLKGW